MITVDLATLSGILRAEESIRGLLGHDSYKNRSQLSFALEALTDKEEGELCLALNALKDHCRALSLAEIPVEEPPQTIPCCPGCKRSMIPTITGGWGCPTLGTPNCMKNTKPESTARQIMEREG